MNAPRRRQLSVPRRFVVAVVLTCALVAAGAAPATAPATAPAAPVVVLSDSPAVVLGAWSTLPITLTLLPGAEGDVFYRWGAGPGPWARATGPIVAPDGKQVLTAMLVSPDGSTSETVTRVVRTSLATRPGGNRPRTGLVTTPAAGASASGQVTVRATVQPVGGVTIRRLGGRDRFDVCVLVSQSSFSAAGTVIIASGEKFPDALTSSGLAGCLNAPLLLTRRTDVPPVVLSEIQRLGATKAIVAGGPLTVDPAVVRQLEARGLSVERIGGANRFAVAANVSQRIDAITGGSSRVFVARGDLFPDALSLGPLAFRNRNPILLVMPTSVPNETSAELGRANFSNAVIAGGTASVSPAVAARVRSHVGALERWDGADRYAAGARIASEGVADGSNSWSYVAVAKGTDFPDALCGGVGAGAHGGVLLLTAPEPLSPPTQTTLELNVGSIRSVEVLGGTASITPATYEQIRAILQ